MKRLFLNEPCEPKDYQYVNAMSNHDFHNKIVVYKTKPHCDTNESGLGILVRNPSDSHQYGFAYHRNLIDRDFERHAMTYTGRSTKDSVTNALKARREVYLFGNFEEFLKFALEHCEY